MSKLRWNQVAAPNLTGVASILASAGNSIDSAGTKFNDMLTDIQKTVGKTKSNELMAKALQYKDADSLNQAMSDGSFFDGIDMRNVNKESFAFLAGQPNRRLTEDSTRAATNQRNASARNQRAAALQTEGKTPYEIALSREQANNANLDGVIKGQTIDFNNYNNPLRLQYQQLVNADQEQIINGRVLDNINKEHENNVTNPLDAAKKQAELSKLLEEANTTEHNNLINDWIWKSASDLNKAGMINPDEIYGQLVVWAEGNPEALAALSAMRKAGEFDVLAFSNYGSSIGAVDVTAPPTGIAKQAIETAATSTSNTTGTTNGTTNTQQSFTQSMPIFQNSLFKHEGAANPDTLYKHSQKEGGQFANIKISNMSLGELSEFSRGKNAYGQWVKTVNPEKVVSTPMGKYQIIGDTLRDVMTNLDLSGDITFNEQTQDVFGLYLAQRVLRNNKSTEARLNGLRTEWVGFKNVSDEDLLKVISEIENSPQITKDNVMSFINGSGGSDTKAVSTAASEINKAITKSSNNEFNSTEDYKGNPLGLGTPAGQVSAVPGAAPTGMAPRTGSEIIEKNLGIPMDKKNPGEPEINYDKGVTGAMGSSVVSASVYLEPGTPISNRNKEDFKPFTLPSGEVLTNDNYRDTGYDRGHLVSQSGLAEAQKGKTNDHSNVVPMIPDMNRGVFNGIERYVNDRANSSSDGVFSNAVAVYAKDGKISLDGKYGDVPNLVLKSFYDVGTKEAGVFVVNNAEGGEYSLMSVNQAKEIFGVDVFPSLSNAQKSAIPNIPENVIPNGYKDYSPSRRVAYENMGQNNSTKATNDNSKSASNLISKAVSSANESNKVINNSVAKPRAKVENVDQLNEEMRKAAARMLGTKYTNEETGNEITLNQIDDTEFGQSSIDEIRGRLGDAKEQLETDATVKSHKMYNTELDFDGPVTETRVSDYIHENTGIERVKIVSFVRAVKGAYPSVSYETIVKYMPMLRRDDESWGIFEYANNEIKNEDAVLENFKYFVEAGKGKTENDALNLYKEIENLEDWYAKERQEILANNREGSDMMKFKLEKVDKDYKKKATGIKSGNPLSKKTGS